MIANLDLAQQFMRANRIDGWLLYDFRGNNQVFKRFFAARHTTRRAILWIPADGQPRLLAHAIDFSQFDDAGVERDRYLRWQELPAWLARLAASGGRFAMEYSAGNALPVVSIADAGFVELVRSCGVEVVSSANLIQVCIAAWSAAAVANHESASRLVEEIKNAAFALVHERTKRGGTVGEFEVQQFIMSRFAEQGLETPDPPICSVNANSGDPHYAPDAQHSATIRRGDWVLIDLWARVPGDDNIYSDITWVGFVGDSPSDEHRRVFDVVTEARDAALKLATERWSRKQAVRGWELDDAARNLIVARGYEHGIKHRTGHSLSPGPLVHGVGMNLDNLETHDTRDMLPGIGFTIEPGVYLPNFGVRSEINVYVDPVKGPSATSAIQREIILA
ncbi:MAG: aminopeptidase P family protein [Phycisphaerales bacterium]|nr:aminopeptidase P family protein [Phycisphaerales bacterium]